MFSQKKDFRLVGLNFKGSPFFAKTFKSLKVCWQRKRESVLDALTWHHYYLNGHTATLQDFLDVQPLDYLPRMFLTVQQFLKKKNISRPLWLGETSSAYGGGAHGLSDRYVGGFLWLDKLGKSTTIAQYVQSGGFYISLV